MYKKLMIFLLLGFLVIGAASAVDGIQVNDGFNATSDASYTNEELDMDLYTWDYDDEIIREAYLQNDTDYKIVESDNNTYNVTYCFQSEITGAMSYLTSGEIPLDYGTLEIAEINGKKYIIMTYVEEGNIDDLERCYDELMKFNELNNIEPLADAI